MKRIPFIAIAFAVCTTQLSFPAAAQTSTQPQAQASQDQASRDQSSLGDYARKVHKNDTSKAKPKVFDNDNLPTDDKLSIVGEPASGSDNKAATATDNKDAAANKPATPPEDDPAKKEAAWKEWQQRLSAQKDQIDLESRELDVLQREYQLRAAAIYADVGNRLRNSAQWDKQEADYKQKIADKQKALDDAKQRLDDMEEEARRAGVPAAMREP
jgi:hypothetical protein